MRRNWLTSTTALALVLNAAAPIPSSALGAAENADRSDAPGHLTQLAENEASTAAQEIMEDVLGTAQADGEDEQTADQTAVEAVQDALTGTDADAQAEADAAADAEAAQKAEAEAAQKAEEAAAAAESEAAQAAQQIEESTTTEAEQKADADAAAAEQKAAEEAADAEVAAQQKAEDAAATEAAADAAAEQNTADEAAADLDAAADQSAEDAADAEADATAEQKADEAAAAEADQKAADDADAQAAEDADAQAEADADAAQEQTGEDVETTATDAAEGTQDASATEDAAATGDAETQEQTVTGEGDATADADAEAAEVPEVSAQAQADAVAEEDDGAPAAAAASGEGEVVETNEGTVTKEQARASNEEFETTASGEQTQAADDDDDDNDLLKAVGAIAAAGLGAYAVGELLDNGGEVVSNIGDRAVVRDPNGQYRIIKDDGTLLRQPGSNVSTQTYSDGSTRTEVVARDNSSTVTIRAADGRVLRRTRILSNGERVVLFDDTQEYDRVDVSTLEPAREEAYDYSSSDVDGLRAALSAKNETLPDRKFSLNQIRRIDPVRHLVPVIALDAINFRTGSAVIDADEAQDLSDLGNAMRAAIDDNPGEVFLIEGHTDTVGEASYNLALSDRRAESVALALTEYFDVSPSNMIVQGYGESDLRVERTGDVPANRRGAVRNITRLLTGK